MRRSRVFWVILLAAGSWGLGQTWAQDRPVLFQAPWAVSHPDAAVGPIVTSPQYEVILLPDTTTNSWGVGVPPDAGVIYLTTPDGVYGFSSGRWSLIAPGEHLAGARFAPGFGFFCGDVFGNIYRLDGSRHRLKVLAKLPGDGQSTIYSVNIDPADGSLYVMSVISYVGQFIYRLPRGSHTPKLIAELPFASFGMGLSGNFLYISDWGNGIIYRMPKKGGAMAPYVSGLVGPCDIAADAGGNLYVTEYNLGNVAAIKSGTTQFYRIVTGLTTPLGIGVDRNGNLYVNNNYAGPFWKIQRSFD